jgi:hypothetical protein
VIGEVLQGAAVGRPAHVVSLILGNRLIGVPAGVYAAIRP